MKTRVVWIWAGIALVVAVVLVGYLLSPAFRRTRDLAFVEETLPGDTDLLVQTLVEDSAIHKGDVFTYIVEVRYDPSQIVEIDTTGLVGNVNLSPFEQRGSRETVWMVDRSTRVYRREYSLQLIIGEADRSYDFPSIVVPYRQQGLDGFSEKTIVPEPVFVASRLPSDASQLELRPLHGKIIDFFPQYLSWILWFLGGVLALLCVANLALRVIPQWRAFETRQRTIQGPPILVEAYRSLLENTVAGIEPRRLLHQMDYILRIVLALKQNCGWLGEPDLASAPDGVRTQLQSLYATCQRDLSEDDGESIDLQASVKQLQEILAFYFGAEVETWRS